MSISIDNTSLFSYNNTAINNASSTSASKLEKTLTSNLENSDDKELMEVCKSFESYFIEQVYKEMKKTVPNNEEENEYMQYFGDMLIQNYAEATTEQGSIGLAKALYESMKRNR